MTIATNRPNTPFDEAYIMKVVEDLGGPRAILDDLGDFRQLVDRLWEERSELMERYPDKWVAVGLDGVVAVGNSMSAVLDEVENLGLLRRDVVVDHLQTDPPVLIL